MVRKDTVSIRTSAQEKAAIVRAAKRRQLTTSRFLAELGLREAERLGYWPPGDHGKMEANHARRT